MKLGRLQKSKGTRVAPDGEEDGELDGEERGDQARQHRHVQVLGGL